MRDTFDAGRVLKNHSLRQNSSMIRAKFLFFILFLSAKWAFADLLYFNTYEENKKAFVDLAGPHFFQSWPLKSNPELTTDLALYRYEKNENLLVLSSGLHGIEGFVGSSLQRALMTQIKDLKKLKTDILFVHSLNPWGMKNKRRVNENNIDLNRNFLTRPDLYKQKNDDYVKINSFLNPTEKLGLGALHRIGFLFDSIRLILANSIDTLRRSILIGQYTEAKGLYFGGKESDELQLKIDILFQKDLISYKTVTWIDIHTGYGERAKLHLLANDSKSEAGQKIQALFPNNHIDFGDQKNFYKTNGDLLSYLLLKTSSKQQVQGIVFEFGTLDSQKTLGSIESLRRMVIENQGFNYGYENDPTKAKANELFSNMFFPQELDWKTKIESQAQELLKPFIQETL